MDSKKQVWLCCVHHIVWLGLDGFMHFIARRLRCSPRLPALSRPVTHGFPPVIHHQCSRHTPRRLALVANEHDTAGRPSYIASPSHHSHRV